MNLQDINKIDNNCNVSKNCQFDIFGLVGKNYPQQEKIITFLDCEDYIETFLQSNMVGVICNADIANIISEKYFGGICICNEPKSLFFQFHNYMANNPKYYGNEKDSQIDYSSSIHPQASISQKGVIIGSNVCIGANTIIKDGVTIEDNVIISEGCIIGAPAFYYFKVGCEMLLVKSVGKVLIGQNVEIHANTIIEKGVLNGETKIERNTKVGNGSIIEHNCSIGMDCIICAGVICAGGVNIGDKSFIGVSASIAPNIKIGANTKVSIGSVITKDIEGGMQVSGNFAVEHSKYIEFIKSIR